ncbi:MAG: hypothetical protein JST40_04915 [Armatimonadetes bacterium]|nr:hypothetical protein [Armatimonadota bacterium]
MRTVTHRLFAALPVPLPDAEQLCSWARSVLDPDEVRVLEPTYLHATIAFYAEATDEQRDRLIDAVRKARFDPFNLVGRDARVFGANAFAVELVPDQETVREFSSFTDRLRGNPGTVDPLRFLLSEAALMGKPTRMPIQFHVTIGRFKSDSTQAGERYSAPKHVVRFNKLCLYESHREPHGSRYEVLTSN